MNFILKNKKIFIFKSNLTKKFGLVRGFSLLEIIVYLAIFTAISIVVINSFIIVLSSFREISSNQDLLNSGSFSMERISREIRHAKNIDLINSQINGGEILQLNSTDDYENPEIFKFIKEGNDLNLYANGSLVGNLLTQNVIITSLTFDRISTIKSEGVKIKMTLKDVKSKTEKIESFYDTVSLRGSLKN